jgi:Trypsin-co-occurring domain 1
MGSEIKVRVVPRPEQEGELAGVTLTERFAQRVDELGDSIGEIAQRLREQLETDLTEEAPSAWHLGEVAVSFSMDLEAEAGVVVARAKSTAGFEVSLTWSRG